MFKLFERITPVSGKISPLNPSLKVIVRYFRFCHDFPERLELCHVCYDSNYKHRKPNKDKNHAFRNL
jgi:hypothetical protein